MNEPTAAPFDPYGFPPDLIAAQKRAADLYAELHRFQATLGWSREPHEGWSDVGSGQWRESARPRTAGWELQEAAEYDRLWRELRDAAALVYTHPHWAKCPDAYKARQALKQVPEALPTAAPGPGQADVVAAA